MRMSESILELIGIGFLAGLLGGMLGVGGSIVMIPAMTELLGADQHLYQSAAMIVNFFVVVPAVYQHRRARAIDFQVVRSLVPLALISVVVGVGLSELTVFSGSGEVYLQAVFGLFLLSIASYDIYRLFRKSSPYASESSSPTIKTPTAKTTRLSWSRVAIVAVPTGLIAGLLGVGGGIIAVPLQRRFLKIPIRQAIANSSTVIIVTAAIGACVKNYAFMSEHGSVRKPLLLAAILIPTAILGSLQGSRLTHRLPLRHVKIGFFTLLIIGAARLCYRAFITLPVLGN